MNDEINQKFIKIENYVRNNDDGFVVDWYDVEQTKWVVYYNYVTNKWAKLCSTACKIGGFCMSESMANKVVDMLNNGKL
jgi:hypothetical protein